MMQYLCWEVALNWKKFPSKGNRIRIGILKLDLPEYVPVGAETVGRRFGILWDMHILHFYGTMHWKIWKCEGKYAQQKCYAAGFFLEVSTFVRLTPYINLSLIILTKRPSFTHLHLPIHIFSVWLHLQIFLPCGVFPSESPLDFLNKFSPS